MRLAGEVELVEFPEMVSSGFDAEGFSDHLPVGVRLTA